MLLLSLQFFQLLQPRSCSYLAQCQCFARLSWCASYQHYEMHMYVVDVTITYCLCSSMYHVYNPA
ncbi:hypothetical protein BS78_08G153400 [Paspalum vaginatum]|nr:hypothetical protein BS78_08G153400 [Paspalum vaginatum]